MVTGCETNRVLIVSEARTPSASRMRRVSDGPAIPSYKQKWLASAACERHAWRDAEAAATKSMSVCDGVVTDADSGRHDGG